MVSAQGWRHERHHPGRGVRQAGGARPLRPHASRPSGYITPHCPQCQPVTSLKLRFVSVTGGNGTLCKVAYAAPWWSWRRGMVSALRAERQSVAYGQSPHHEPRPPPIRPRGAPAVLPVLCLVLVGGTLFFMRAWMGGLRKKSLVTRMDASGSNDTASAISPMANSIEIAIPPNISRLIETGPNMGSGL